MWSFFLSSRRRHTRCALVTGVQTCALPIYIHDLAPPAAEDTDIEMAPQEDEDTLRQKTDKLRRQLDDFGNINPMAMEDYHEMNERYTFIIRENRDLLDAKNSLFETIQEIDQTARTKFMDAFTQVR